MVSSGTGQPHTKPSQGVLFLLRRSGVLSMSVFFIYHLGKYRLTGNCIKQFSPSNYVLRLPDSLLQYLHLTEVRLSHLVVSSAFVHVDGTANELGRGFGVHIHTFNDGTGQCSVLEHLARKLTQEYSTENLSGTQKAMLEDLRDYGLIWQRRPSSRRFSPTRLSTALTSSPSLPTSTGTSSGPQEGLIILETNYQVYVYTNNLFSSLKYRFPNLVVGSITRDSVRKALMNGISTDQIISYSVAHAYPQMSKNVTPCFQSRCRTMGTRTKSSEVARRQYFFPLREDLLNLTNISNLGTRDIYTAFASQADYEFVLNYAKELDVVIRENNAKRCFLGPLKGHSNIKGFIERRRLGASSGVVRYSSSSLLIPTPNLIVLAHSTIDQTCIHLSSESSD
ncbi:hypothetical protein CVT25_000568 [Psilocybe cyanescens]|uniref:RNA polymerase II transcription factor B subunit 2 n=1 Tax=Psilocybe cyanescens TaxID=93625 RepID=A0A409WZX1_PSICY|nr:hypothetical protein CVT25_000568 [Psilocybe cyanescens]